MTNQIHRHIKNILNEIAEPIKKTYGVEYQISGGTLYKKFKRDKKGLLLSLEALKCSFYSDLNSIVFYITQLKTPILTIIFFK